MLKCLWVKHPEKLDLPSETEIMQRITSLTAKHKKHGTIDLKRHIQESFKGIIMDVVVDSEHRIRPKQALEIFNATVTERNLTDHEDKPDDKQVKSFISSVKSKSKKDKDTNTPPS